MKIFSTPEDVQKIFAWGNMGVALLTFQSCLRPTILATGVQNSIFAGFGVSLYQTDPFLSHSLVGLSASNALIQYGLHAARKPRVFPHVAMVSAYHVWMTWLLYLSASQLKHAYVRRGS